MRSFIVISAALCASLAFAGEAVEIKSDALKKKPDAVKGKAAVARPLRVDGIVISPESAFVIINGRAYVKGEGGEDFIVKEIEPKRVLIESSSGLEYLPLKPSERSSPSGAAG